MNKQNEIEAKFLELQKLAEQRRTRLISSQKFWRFLREADEVAEWVGDQTTLTASEEYGRDVEHVELLIQQFETFLSSLSASESRVSSCLATGQVLIAENNPESDRIRAKIEDTQQLWEDLKELAHARQEALAGAKQVHVFDRTADETIAWIQEKENNLVAEGYGQDLETIQALIRKHQGFETDLAAVREQVEAVKEEATRLAGLFPDAREHIEVKHEDTIEAWNELLEHAAQRKDKLQQAEQLQAYFEEYRDLMAWINEMIAKITAPDLTQDVAGAEALITRHKEYLSEIDTRRELFANFSKTGNALIKQGHFLANEIEEKINVLEQRKNILQNIWDQRMKIYSQNLDTQIFKREADVLENWIISREPILHDGKLGESIPQVEELIKKHDDFEKTIEAQDEKFGALRRVTMLEEAFQKQQEEEQAQRLAERERLDRERIEARKRLEVQRITDERRREDDRRRIQELRSREDINGSSPQIETGIGLNLEPMESPQKNKFLNIGDRRGDIKRAESMKVELKKPKRTPSFTTRRRTQSFRKLQRLEPEQLPPVEVKGYLDRKHELQSGGKKAPMRSWKTFYTVLCGQLLCFFKDLDDFVNSKAATSPIIVYKARCEKAGDYTKRKHVFRLCCTDGSEFLFLANTEGEMEDWVNKISFHAQLPPSMQLLSYDDSQKSPATSERQQVIEGEDGDGDASSVSSRASTPEVPRRGDHPTPQTQLLQQYNRERQAQMSDRPPVPPRGAPPPIPVRSPSTEAVTLRTKSTDNIDASVRPQTYQQTRTSVPPHQNGVRPQETWNRVDSTSQVYGNVGPPVRQQTSTFGGERPTSLPPYPSHTLPAGAVASGDFLSNERSSESPTDSDQQIPAVLRKDKDKDKRSSVLSNLFRKKRATHL